MRALAALVAVVSLGVIVYWSTSAGEVPTLDLVDTSFIDELSLEAGTEEGDPSPAETPYPGEGGEAGPQTILEMPDVAAIQEMASNLFIPELAPGDEPQVNGGECWPVITNPDFEGRDGWDMPATEYAAQYSEEQALSPSTSAKTGITNASVL